MNPTEKLEFNQMKEELRQLRSVTNPEFIAELNRRLGGLNLIAESGASTTGTSIAVGNVANDNSETVADEYDGVLTLTDNQGNAYRIGYYS